MPGKRSSLAKAFLSKPNEEFKKPNGGAHSRNEQKVHSLFGSGLQCCSGAGCAGNVRHERSLSCPEDGSAVPKDGEFRLFSI